MDIVEVKRRYGKKLCLSGGVDVDLLSRGTPDEVRALVRKHIAEVGPEGAWCAGSSNSVPEYVPVENYRVMVETVIAEGKY
jgi:uroporphyrinogen decarboxylase